MRFDKIPIIVSDPHLYLENNERSLCRAIQMTDAYEGRIPSSTNTRRILTQCRESQYIACDQRDRLFILAGMKKALAAIRQTSWRIRNAVVLGIVAVQLLLTPSGASSQSAALDKCSSLCPRRR